VIDLARYSRQILFPEIGEEGQRRLLRSRVLVLGCGALGSVTASTLARAGVGFLRIVDRDFVEENNLQRQVLFDEEDVRANLPKAVAAQRRLARVNSQIEVEGLVDDVNHRNIERFIDGMDVILDGTDNFETRFLLNDACLRHAVPWVYGACVASYGMTMPILPGRTPCLRCVVSELPPVGSSPTCDTAGVIASIANVIGSLQGVEALKILTGHLDEVRPRMTIIDAWKGTFETIDLSKAKGSGSCPTCDEGHFDFLEGRAGASATTLCGRNAVQIAPGCEDRLDLGQLAERLKPLGKVGYNEYLLKLSIEGYELTLFPDGRAIIKGTNDVATARGLYAKYVGS